VSEKYNDEWNEEDGHSIPGHIDSFTPWLEGEGSPAFHDPRLFVDDNIRENYGLRDTKH